MLKVKVLAVKQSRLEEWLGTALLEYEKRLTAQIQFEWVDVRSLEDLAKALEKEKTFIALHERGEELDSGSFSEQLTKLFIQHKSRLTMVIGGAAGLPEALLQKASWQWSLSKMTFPHQIVRLLIVEQIYRATEIQKGSSYHK